MQRLVDMFLFSRLVFKALEIERSEEFNLVENINKCLFLSLLKNLWEMWKQVKSWKEIEMCTPVSMTVIFTKGMKQKWTSLLKDKGLYVFDNKQ